jgi:hypothetical protein
VSTPELIHVRPDYAGRCWSASFFTRDGEADPDTFALFGTATLPLPWTLHADERKVMADLRDRFPAAIVERV